MSEPINDGGPAFPGERYSPEGERMPWQSAGMSLLDHFAGLAMQAFAIDPDFPPKLADEDFEPDEKGLWRKVLSSGQWVATNAPFDPAKFNEPHKLVSTYEYRVGRAAYRQAAGMIESREAFLKGK